MQLYWYSGKSSISLVHDHINSVQLFWLLGANFILGDVWECQLIIQ